MITVSPLVRVPILKLSILEIAESRPSVNRDGRARERNTNFFRNAVLTTAASKSHVCSHSHYIAGRPNREFLVPIPLSTRGEEARGRVIEYARGISGPLVSQPCESVV
jgi:hypothetical protein